MPELPEVEASRALIEQHCVGRTITAVDAADDAKVFDGATAAEVVAAMGGRKVTGAHRKGKQMWLTFDGDGPHALLHFGMTGYTAIKDDADDGQVHVLAYENAPHETSAWPPRFHKLVLSLGPKPGGKGGACHFAYCDARRFGKIKLVDGDPAQCETVAKLGFDPLTDMPDLEAFKELLKARTKGATRLKPLLLDQSFSAGVGNWVADEVLWQARLHPEQLVAVLGEDRVAALHAALRSVVATAVAVDADSSRFPADWMFHVRWGKKTGQLGGHKIDFITVGSRTSCFVPTLQKLVGSSRPPKPAKQAAAKSKPDAKQQPKKKDKKRKQRRAEESEDDDGDAGTSSGGGDGGDAAAAAEQGGAAAPGAADADADADGQAGVSRRRPGAKRQKKELAAAAGSGKEPQQQQQQQQPRAAARRRRS